MKRISLFLLVTLVFGAAGVLNAQTFRTLGGRSLIMDNGDGNTLNSVFFIDRNGTLGLANNPIVTGSYPSANTLLSLNLTPGGKGIGLNIAGNNTSINADGAITTTGVVTGGTVNSTGNMTASGNLNVTGSTTLGSGGLAIQKEFFVEGNFGSLPIVAGGSYFYNLAGGALANLSTKDAVIAEFSDPTFTNNLCPISASVVSSNGATGTVQLTVYNPFAGNFIMPATTVRFTIIHQ